MEGPRYRPEDYQAAEPVLSKLKCEYRAGRITWQQAQTIKGQALAGDIDGARKEVDRMAGREAQAHA